MLPPFGLAQDRVGRLDTLQIQEAGLPLAQTCMGTAHQAVALPQITFGNIPLGIRAPLAGADNRNRTYH